MGDDEIKNYVVHVNVIAKVYVTAHYTDDPDKIEELATNMIVDGSLDIEDIDSIDIIKVEDDEIH